MVRTTFVAITGSVGKTTTKDCLGLILSAGGPTLMTDATANSAKDVSRTLLRVRPWHRFAVIEVGTDAPGWVRRSGGLVRPDIAVILTVARTHTNNLPTLEAIATEKASLLTTIRRGGVAILNADDPHVAAMRPPARCRRILFGEAPGSDFRAANVGMRWPGGLSYDLVHGDRRARIETQMIGRHWVTCTLGAIAAAVACGMPLVAIADALRGVPPSPARMQPQPLPGGAVMIRDDGAGSIDSFEQALNAMTEIPAARKFLVISTVTDTGQRGRDRAELVGRAAAVAFDGAVFVGRYAPHGRRAAIAGGMPEAAAQSFRDLRLAAAWLRENIRTGDVVLLRGRGVDHMARLYWAIVSEVACWKRSCRKMILCDECDELHGGRAGRR
jgi:UDP-N-acetylmuramoyl-tripeptide--D-alanyl-D-alanine ligase